MAKSVFSLPPVSPLLGSTLRVFEKTIEGNTIAPQFKAKKNNTKAIIYLISPFRWYERAFILPRARKKNPKEVVFIVGHWRGGTTFLHNLMCQAVNATYVSTYQTVFPNFMGTKWLFGMVMKGLIPDKRPSDNVKLAVNFPQEEEFALSGTNPYAYYRFMYFPEHYKKYYAESMRLEGLNDHEKQTFIQDYKDILHKALLKKPGDVMIVKNPANTARIKLLHKAYPNAKWIHIYRNPFTVYRSTLKFFSELLPTLWFDGVSDEFIQEMILETYVKLYQDYDDAIAGIPGLDLVELKFEDFEKDPIGNLESIYKKFGFNDFEKSRARFENYIGGQKSYQKNIYSMPRDMVDMIKARWGEYIERWGYDVPG